MPIIPDRKIASLSSAKLYSKTLSQKQTKAKQNKPKKQCQVVIDFCFYSEGYTLFLLF
jgi:hypothetical protein